MRLYQIHATFGCLENASLDLQPGLNIIEAPNESGKSTWAAALRVLFYGLSTKDRGALADKRRYQPWSGSLMTASACLCHLGQDLTVTRHTLRPDSPMGSFSACFAGTASPVEGLTAANCGETLLGVPQDVFERSAFIRQSGLSIRQSAALERRIASLIATGEEDVSYTDAADRLKKQLNRRRYHKSGQLPQLESEISALRTSLREAEELSAALEQDRARLASLQAQRSQVDAQLTLYEQLSRQEAEQRSASARRELAAARAQVSRLSGEMGDLPPKEELIQLSGSAAALAILSRDADRLQAEARQAESSLRTAQAVPAPRTASRPWPLLWAALAGVAAGALLLLLTAPPAAIGGGAGIFLAFVLLWMLLRRRGNAPAGHDTILYREAEAAQQALQRALSAQEAMNASLAQRLPDLLAQVRRFQPQAHDLPTAQQAIAEGLRKYESLDSAIRRVDDALRSQGPSVPTPPPPSAPIQRPSLSREELIRQREALDSRIDALQRRILTGEGQSRALDSPHALREQLADRTSRQQALQAEYDAIALAAQVLEEAHTALQSHFAPALGEKSAEIFTKLTQKKYNTVLLDRDLAPSTRQMGQLVPREAALLSQGTADQLYLSVRLAICQLALPEETPIVLDDALVSFDDQRMAAALDLLLELSLRRQVLLFTCQRREADYLTRAHPGRFHLIRM